jgi:hypothetical protein
VGAKKNKKRLRVVFKKKGKTEGESTQQNLGRGDADRSESEKDLNSNRAECILLGQARYLLVALPPSRGRTRDTNSNSLTFYGHYLGPRINQIGLQNFRLILMRCHVSIRRRRYLEV